MSPAGTPPRFDPKSILTTLQAGAVGCVVIGGLARVARGSDELTTGVDICPSLQSANLARLQTALADMGAVRRDGAELVLDEAHLRAEPVIDLGTPFGELKVIAAPAGVPRGYDALRAGTTRFAPARRASIWAEVCGRRSRRPVTSPRCPPRCAATRTWSGCRHCAGFSNSKRIRPVSSPRPRHRSCSPATPHAPRRATSSARVAGVLVRVPASVAESISQLPPRVALRDGEGRHTTCTHGAAAGLAAR